MSDNAPQPLKVITCLDETGQREQCGALVENTLEARRIHRKWHAQDKTVKDALRSAAKARDSEVRNLKLQLADMQRDVENIDIPEPAAPVEIAHDGWTDDDEPDQPAEPADDEYETPTVAPATANEPVATLNSGQIYPSGANLDDDFPGTFRG